MRIERVESRPDAAAGPEPGRGWRDRHEARIVAYVDAANPDANALARRAADDKARSFRCGKDRPEVVGRPGGATDLAVRTRVVN